MISEAEFVAAVLDGVLPSVPSDQTGSPEDAEVDIMEAFGGLTPTGGGSGPGDSDGPIGSFARRLLAASGFGAPEELDAARVLSTSATQDPGVRSLPVRLFYWRSTPARPHHTLLAELTHTGSGLLEDNLFQQERKEGRLEDAVHRLVQTVLRAFERRSQESGAAVERAAQHDTLVVVSVLDDIEPADAPKFWRPAELTCFGTRWVEGRVQGALPAGTGSLATFVIHEAARHWEDRGLAEDHIRARYQRHFSKLAAGERWRDAFVRAQERELVGELRKAWGQQTIGNTVADEVRGALRNLLDEIASSYGIKRDQGKRIKSVPLPDDHDIGANEDVSSEPTWHNPIQAARLFVAKQSKNKPRRLMGYLLVVVDHQAHFESLRKQLAQYNRYHNVLVVSHGEKLEIQLWQGQRPLVGRLVQGDGRSTFDGDTGIIHLLSRFFVVSRSSIGDSAKLAEELAYRARNLRRLALREIGREATAGGGPLSQLRASFSASLAQLSDQDFADAYAQTLTYGLLAARWLSHVQPDSFTRDAIADLLPSTTPFLKALFRRLFETDFDTNVNWMVDDIVSLLGRTAVKQVFAGEGGEGPEKDPSIHFYEGFLDHYDPKLRKERGVYYTPDEVVAYIVKTAHRALQERFGLRLGLADTATWRDFARHQSIPVPDGVDPAAPFVQILDPATGTGTFLLWTITVIHETMMAEWSELPEEKRQEKWRDYVRKHLLKRMSGFEIMVAPYMVCHLRLGLKLQDTGFELGRGKEKDQERLQVYLTNTLEMLDAQQKIGDADVARESEEAEVIKNNAPISVIVGNPPYAAVSQNNGEWIVGLLKGVSPSGQATGSYYEIDGQPLGEKKLWLNDDYVKFIRMAQWRIECSGVGVVGMVTNNGYLSNPTFRGMRQQLMRTFPRIEVIDLNGSTKNRRRVPQGVTDENVFQIQQGVAIAIMVRSATASSSSAPSSVVLHRDVWGLRKEKLTHLDDGVGGLAALAPSSPYYFFFPWRQVGGSADFFTFIKVTDLMATSTTGFITARDGLVVDFDAERLLDRIKEFRDLAISDAAVRSRFFGGRSEGKYPPGDTRGWKLSDARKKVAADRQWRTRAKSCLYRPFDTRQVYYAPWMVDWPRENVFVHLRPAATNRCLMVCRQIVSPTWTHVLVADRIVDDSCVSNKSRERGYAFPLYLSPEADGARRVPNFAESAVARFEQALGPRRRWSTSGKATSWPELLFGYIVAILHSPEYRKRYLNMLQVDFPKIPVPATLAAFQDLSDIGRQIASAYLLEVSPPAALAKFNGTDRGVVKVGETGKTLRLAAPGASQGRLFINTTTYFDAIPVASWELAIGAYQVCHKWLDDRRKRKRSLSDEEIATFRSVVAACGRIVELSTEIDQCVERAGGWSSLFAAESVSDE